MVGWNCSLLIYSAQWWIKMPFGEVLNTLTPKNEERNFFGIFFSFGKGEFLPFLPRMHHKITNQIFNCRNSINLSSSIVIETKAKICSKICHQNNEIVSSIFRKCWFEFVPKKTLKISFNGCRSDVKWRF